MWRKLSTTKTGSEKSMHFLFLYDDKLEDHLKGSSILLNSPQQGSMSSDSSLVLSCSPTAQRRRQGGLVKSYFYPQYLNSDDCRGVFDVT